MAYVFDRQTPIYLQLMRLFRRQVISGEWKIGQQIPTVRDLALQYGVNPNTMQRALSELEREGLLSSNRRAGRFVSADQAQIASVRSSLAGSQIADFIEAMRLLQFDWPTLQQLLARKWRETDGID